MSNPNNDSGWPSREGIPEIQDLDKDMVEVRRNRRHWGTATALSVVALAGAGAVIYESIVHPNQAPRAF